jgi:hypothetical protein
VATPFEKELEEELSAHPEHVLILAGAGVACATDTNPCASWQGLVKDGLERCRQRCHSLGDGWFSITQQMIAEGKASEWIQAASRIERALRNVHGGEYGRWLADSVGRLRLVDRRIIDALLGWRTRIATTNYDNLIEEASQLRPIVWSQGALALQVLRGDQPGVLHLHGHFSIPEIVVFGATTYEDICRDISAQNMLRSILTRDTVVFVGCGAGIEDPNFGSLFEWSKIALQNCQHTHYHLVRESELKSVAEQYDGLGVTPVVYGTNYADLAPFLEGISDRVRQRNRAPLPLELLTLRQSDYDRRKHELAEQAGMPAPEFVRRNFELARQHWQAGGRRTAALHMLSALNAKGNELPRSERIDYSLEALEYLLEDGLDSHTTILIGTVEKLLAEFPGDANTLARFRMLLTQCLNARAQVDKLFQAIDAALPLASADEKSRLEAERAELHFLNGDLERAARDSGLERS